MVDWMADYLSGVGQYPVKPDVRPGDIRSRLPDHAPELPEDFDRIFKDFEDIIMPGMTHWQHPGFMAYFPASNSEPSILGEMLTATLGAQCMLWLTSPAAEELEQRMMEWLRDAMGVTPAFTGVIQDSSSSSTLVAILTARESCSKGRINLHGFTGSERFRVYTSTQAHSSVDKAVRIAGIGSDNLVKVEVDDAFAMRADALDKAIQADIRDGYRPLAVISTIGTTSSTAIDPVGEIQEICARYGCWHHVDASYAGTVLLLPEFRWMGEGLDGVDSWVFNPHKWMFTNFDCSAYFVRDPAALQATFSILPEYLKTPEDKLVNNYRDWGVPLGRRFRALKLWFVLRSFGLEGLRNKLREHLSAAEWLRDRVLETPGIELMAPVTLNLICIRFNPPHLKSPSETDAWNAQLLQRINDSGKLLLTQTRIDNKFIIRIVPGNINSSLEFTKQAWEFIVSQARQSGW